MNKLLCQDCGVSFWDFNHVPDERCWRHTVDSLEAENSRLRAVLGAERACHGGECGYVEGLRTRLDASEKKERDQWEEIGKQSGRAEDLLKKLKASEAAREKADADIKEHEKLNTELLTSLLFTKQRAEKAEKDLEERIADWTLQWGELSCQLKESRVENSRLNKELANLLHEFKECAECPPDKDECARADRLRSENSRLRAVVAQVSSSLRRFRDMASRTCYLRSEGPPEYAILQDAVNQADKALAAQEEGE